MNSLNQATALAGRLIPVLICAAAFLAIGVAVDSPPAKAGANAQLALDFDVSGGACNTIDASASIAPATTVQVAVCFNLSGNTDPVGAFRFNVVYDDTIVDAAEVADAGTALEDNPDANDGNEFSTPGLGSGWDCSGGVGAFPTGDADPDTGAGQGKAFSGGCSSAAGPNTLLGDTGFAPLAVITFTGVGGGTSNVEFDPNGTSGSPGGNVTGDSLSELGSCFPTIDVSMSCTGGTITVSGATATPGAATNTPAPPTDTPTPTATGGATEVPATTAPGTTPPPPGATATRPSGRPGVGVVGPDTGFGPGGDAGPSFGFLMLAASGAAFVAVGTVVAARRRLASRR
jgi:hypothetical protein